MIRRLRTVSIAVHDTEEALRFYRDALGLAVRGAEGSEWHGLRLTRLGAGEAEIVLMEPTTSDGAVGRFVGQRGDGLYHITFEVEDIELAMRTLLARGGQLWDREPRDGPDGRIAFVLAPSTAGIVIELWEPAGARNPEETAP